MKYSKDTLLNYLKLSKKKGLAIDIDKAHILDEKTRNLYKSKDFLEIE